VKQRYLYALIFGLPGVLLSAFASIYAGGAVAGFFWIIVFGDNIWPFWAEGAITAIGILAFIAALAIIVRIGFTIGKKRENENTHINNKHILISVAVLILLIFRIIIFQRGYIFKKPDHRVCSDLCAQKGFGGSSMVLRPNVSGKKACSCWNDATKEYEVVGAIE